MASKYFLLSKTTQKFVDYEGRAIRLNKSTPYTVDEVLIAKKGRTTPCKKITTFKDSNGEITERIFNYSEKPIRNRVYQRQEHVIGDNEIVQSTQIKEYFLPRKIVDIYKKFQENLNTFNIQTVLWEKGKVQTNHVSDNINNGEKILSKTTIITNSDSGNDFLHTFVEYPKIKNGKIERKPVKSLEFGVDKSYNVDYASIRANGVKSPSNDSFLGYRILSVDDVKEPITEKFIKDRGVGNLGYIINTDYLPEDGSETLCGLFYDGNIMFNKLYDFKSKSNVVSTSRHEVEHGWQYYLDARNGGKRGENLEEIGKTYGKITDKKLKKEADVYTQSMDNYVPHYVDYERYRKNYIEIRANKAGAKAKQEYDEQGKTIREDFRHIPKELL